MTVTLEPISAIARILIDRSPPPELDAETQRRVNEAWSDQCARNPKYFDAPILVYEGFEPGFCAITARVDQYKHHAVQDVLDLGLSILAVTAILCAPDRERGVPVYLVGQRSSKTHRYGGQWELGPSGGVDVPADDLKLIGLQQLIAEVVREVREEIGVDVTDRPYSVLALVHDHGVGSTDIAIGFMLDRIPQVHANWEYDDTRWVTLDELIVWCRETPDELIPTTIALARYLDQSRD